MYVKNKWFNFAPFFCAVACSSAQEIHILVGKEGFPSQKPSLSVLTKVPPMICIRVLPDPCWISGEPSGQRSNVFGPLEVLVEKICLAMARTNRWE